jgi:hypothetical protein
VAVSQQTILEGFAYAVTEADLPRVGPDGLPTGATIRRHLLAFVDESGVRFEVRFSEQDWDAFVKEVQGRKVAIAGAHELSELERVGIRPGRPG